MSWSAAAVAAELAAKRVVELVDVDAVEPAVVGDVPLEFKRHLLHVSERASTRGLGDPNVVGTKLGERVSGESLGAQFGLDHLDDVVA